METAPAVNMTAGDLDKWTRRAERLIVGKNHEYFKQGVGLKVDKNRLARLERDSLEHSKLFLTSFGKEPESLFMMSVDTIGLARTYKLLLELNEARIGKIVSRRHKLNGRPVNWGSWRQFAGQTDDSTARKELFDDFVEKSEILAPIIAERFSGYAKAVSEHGTDALTIYLNHERITYEALTAFIDGLGSRLKPAFRRSLKRYSSEILGRDAEYYDDFYFFRTRVFRDYAETFPVKDPVSQIIRTMKIMGLDASGVKVDSADRKGKNASAFCSAIRIPSDVRISYRRSNPLEDFTGIFHEFGHAIHFASIDPHELFWNKYDVSDGVAETFSIFFEGLMHDLLYLKGELGISDAMASDLIRRFRFNELYFATFYSANSMMKVRYWHDNLSLEKVTEIYSDLTETYMGIRYPGGYWRLHHVMPDAIVYTPSYLLAAVRAHELREALRSKYGEKYWKERDSGRFLLGLMRVGQAIELEQFSRLDASSYAKSLDQAGT